jgi:dTDP-4-amino-4,6-dideoxygalactose transaminase
MSDWIPFSKPFLPQNSFSRLNGFSDDDQCLRKRDLTNECISKLKGIIGTQRIELSKSCTQALEMSALILNIQPGDEVIMPSFGYVATANAFVLRGARCRFVDIDPETLNIDPIAVANALDPKVKAIVTINYSGIACDYDAIKRIQTESGVALVEDNAMGLGAFCNDQPLGNFGDLATFSFDYLKNITCGEGGAIVLNNDSYAQKFDLISENGTNKLQFLRGESDLYEWKGTGTNSYLSEILAAVLCQQLDYVEHITQLRLSSWNFYQEALSTLQSWGNIRLVKMPDYARHNAHNFLIFTNDQKERTDLIKFLKGENIEATFHYVPLHSSEFGRQVGHFAGEDRNTTKASKSLIRLPLYTGMENAVQQRVVEAVYRFFKR